MPQLIKQPAGDSPSKRNMEHTVWRRVAVDDLAKRVSASTLSDLRARVPAGYVAAWGITPSKDGLNEGQWRKIQPGDVVVFGSNRNRTSAKGVVVATAHAPALAERLWGYKDDAFHPGTNEPLTWEYVYFLDEVEALSCDKRVINRLISANSEVDAWQRINVVDEERAEPALSALGLLGEDYPMPVDQQSFESAVKRLVSGRGTDAERSVKARKEQRFLRDYLFGDGQPKACAICGEQFPREFLVAAHIKKRSLCTEDERLDFENIVVPMCKFGCDALYEDGFVVVAEGIVDRGRPLPAQCTNDPVHVLEGRSCVYWNVERATYFRAHRERHLSRA